MLELIELLGSGGSLRYVLSLLGLSIGAAIMLSGVSTAFPLILGIALCIISFIALVIQIRNDILDIQKDLKKSSKK